ncbi:response regulator [Rhodobacter sp. 24-YEA-8]|uniref:response regulator n=1 Tax=Rhodobacter sp. 24-YEA-8 TaxID=1884310 RepID=UPI00089B9412|nr:response regulator [Rhodobacter sp. 24-YEA-8]SED49608.1 Response regulator receiver domain-containing protein [Rhodobacter sp. 24-YEA-8]
MLVAEDEYLLAADLTKFLQRAGARVIGPFPTVREALEGLRTGVTPDFAMLDVNLRGEMVFPLADHLVAAAIPFIFITGYDTALLPQAYAAIPRLEKPINL